MSPQNYSNGRGALLPSRGTPPLEWVSKRGVARARETNAIEPREDDIRSLTALAKTMAAYVAQSGFDPGAAPGDRLREALFKKTDTSVRRLDEELKIAAKRVTESSNTAGRKRAQVGTKPELPLVSMVTAVGVLAVSVAPTLHDFVFHTLPDDLLNWFLSIIVSALLGVMLAWGMFAISVTDSRKPVVVGIIISLGLGALRLSAAENLNEVLFAVGLALMEIGVVLFLDWRAGVFNKALADWGRRTQEAEEAEASSAVERREFDRLAAERQKLEAQVLEHVTDVEHRDELARDNSAREQAYVEAICDSYMQGIAENRGRLQAFK
jgi:hypothetical protein